MTLQSLNIRGWKLLSAYFCLKVVQMVHGNIDDYEQYIIN